MNDVKLARELEIEDEMVDQGISRSAATAIVDKRHAEDEAFYMALFDLMKRVAA